MPRIGPEEEKLLTYKAQLILLSCSLLIHEGYFKISPVFKSCSCSGSCVNRGVGWSGRGTVCNLDSIIFAITMKYNKLLHAHLLEMHACMHVICQHLAKHIILQQKFWFLLLHERAPVSSHHCAIGEIGLIVVWDNEFSASGKLLRGAFLSSMHAYMMQAIRVMTYFQVQQSKAEPELDSTAWIELRYRIRNLL